MTEKRFTIEECNSTYTFNDYGLGCTTGFKTDEVSLIVMEEMCGLLNSLSEENEQLKTINSALERRLKKYDYGDFKYE